MNLNINNLTPASLKAKNVATENYVDSAEAAAIEAAEAAEETALLAIGRINDIADDNKFTAVEKTSTLKEWNTIQSEQASIQTQATTYAVSTVAYATAFNALEAYIVPLLTNTDVTSNIVSSTFNDKFRDYYTAKVNVLNAIATAAANRAESNATSAATSAVSSAETRVNNSISSAETRANTYASTVASTAESNANSYTNTAVGNIDVSGDIANNNEVFAKKMGYPSYSAMVSAASLGQTIINGGYINTPLIQANAINAEQINTTGLIAEDVTATDFHGKNFYGGYFEGALIVGSVIRASYLDLDGELEILTNYHLVLSEAALYIIESEGKTGRIVLEADKSENGGDAVYSEGDNEWRIPTLSKVYESTSSKTNGTLTGRLSSYATTNVHHNNKAVSIRPTFNVDANVRVFYSSISMPPNGGINLKNIIKIGATEIFRLDYTPGGYTSYTNVTMAGWIPNNNGHLYINGVSFAEPYPPSSGSANTATVLNQNYTNLGFTFNIKIIVSYDIGYSGSPEDTYYPTWDYYNVYTTVTLVSQTTSLGFDWVSGSITNQAVNGTAYLSNNIYIQNL